MLTIRQENEKDYEDIYNVLETAFATAEHSDGNEQDLVVALRKSSNFIPELSLVAVIDDKLAPFDVPDENFMAIKLNEPDTEVKGVVQYAKEFGI